ncbi:MAG: methyltransferase domain-containing protein [Cocleimonas sp.]|nr:methyltransferase domain-containing protein [Cocleimonas sp.]
MNDGLYKSYSFIMKNLGFDASIAAFIKKLNIRDGSYNRILDAGCGTGTIGMALAKRYPEASIMFTDINKTLLDEVTSKGEKEGFLSSRLSFAHADISSPKTLTLQTNKAVHLSDAEFDIVATGAVVGYSQNQKKTLEELLSLVKPKGYFINIEMNQGFFGSIVSKKYQYPVMPLAEMESIIKSTGFELMSIEVDTFPAKLTRTCLIAYRR